MLLAFQVANAQLITPSNNPDKTQYLHNGESYYMPFEHTICLSKRWNWFQKKELIPVRELDELEELFYWCTDNDNTLVVNVTPDQTGKIREHEANAVIALGKRLGIKKNKPLPRNGKFISLSVPAYCIDIWTNNAWKTIYMGEESMNDCKVIRFPNAYKTSKLRFRVLKASAPPSITELNVIYM